MTERCSECRYYHPLLIDDEPEPHGACAHSHKLFPLNFTRKLARESCPEFVERDREGDDE